MKLKFYFIGLVIFLNSSSVLAQSLFNKLYPINLGIPRIEMLHETEEGYYTVGYADYGPEVGVQVVCYDKKTGDTLRSAYFEIEGWWIFTAGRTPIIEEGKDLMFGMCGKNALFRLAYNRDKNKITIQDSVQCQLGGTYINDMIIKGDTTIYHTTLLLPDENINAIIYSYPDKTRKFIYLPRVDSDNKLTNYTSGRLFINHDTLVMIGSKYYNTLSYVTFIEANMKGEIISEFTSKIQDFDWDVNDALRLNQDEYLVLASSEYKDHVNLIFDLIHVVYRINMKTKKVIWRKEYSKPTTDDFTTGGDIIAGHKTNEYLYNTVATAKGSTKDSLFTVGRVVKIDGNGKKIWLKDFSYSTQHNHDNEPVTLLSTSDGNYIMGGHINTRMDYSGWLIKFDEDGNIVPIDTTSATTQPIRDIPAITIYPNPAHDHIIINQGEQTDMTYTIYEFNGRIALEQKVKGSHQNTVWDISALRSGAYILVASQKGKQLVSRQLIVE